MSSESAGGMRDASDNGSGAPVRIYAVIVLYRQAAAASTTLRTLLESARQLTGGDVNLEVLLYDNTPQAWPELPDSDTLVRYHASHSNHGLSGAYNEALRRAQADGFDWLLTLDQDTALPPTFLRRMAERARACQADEGIAAVVPRLMDGNRQVSPMRVGFFGHAPLLLSWNGVAQGRVQALNSAALLRISALREMDGFHPLFWLNYLDNWLHRELGARGKRIFVANDVVIEHELSLLDYRGRMTLAHYTDFLMAEGAFRDLYGGLPTRLAYTAQLVLRWLNQKRRKEKREILTATRHHLHARLVQRRAARLKKWETEMGARLEAPRP